MIGKNLSITGQGLSVLQHEIPIFSSIFSCDGTRFVHVSVDKSCPITGKMGKMQEFHVVAYRPEKSIFEEIFLYTVQVTCNFNATCVSCMSHACALLRHVYAQVHKCVAWLYSCVNCTCHVHICDPAWENRAYVHIKFDHFIRLRSFITLWLSIEYQWYICS